MTVSMWLHGHELQGYWRLFEAAGYKSRDDLDNLIGFTEEDLQRMGIHMRGMCSGTFYPCTFNQIMCK